MTRKSALDGVQEQRKIQLRNLELERLPTGKLRLEKVAHPARLGAVRDRGTGRAGELELEDADLVAADDELEAVVFSRRELVDREDDASFVKSLRLWFAGQRRYEQEKPCDAPGTRRTRTEASDLPSRESAGDAIAA